jgi:hypothetical protein
MATILSIILGTLVLWVVAFGPVHFGLLPRRTEARTSSNRRVELAKLLLALLVVAVCLMLLQRIGGTRTLIEAIAYGVVLWSIPAAFLVGVGVQSGSARYVLPRATLFLSAFALSSIAIFLVRQ